MHCIKPSFHDRFAKVDSLGTITFAILVIALVAVTGLLVGTVRVRGVGLGSAGVLFAGLLFGNFGASIDPTIAEFAKEFGLILFVFTIGLQLGPGIVQLWKQQGLLLNAMAVSVVLQGVALTIAFLFLFDLSALTATGLFSGATTNTPSLGAAEQAATMRATGRDNSSPNREAAREPTGKQIGQPSRGTDTLLSAYAVAYPGGIVGIIAAMLLLRRLFRIDVSEEAKQLEQRNGHDREPIQRRCLVVDNRRLNGVPFGRIPGADETEVRISRIRRAGEPEVHAATEETELQEGDTIQVVGRPTGLDRFAPLIGHPTDVDLMQTTGDAEFRRVVVTESHALQKSLRDLSLDNMFGATVTRIIRAGVEMPARGRSRFYYGDIAHVVGDKDSLGRVTQFLGNSAKSLNETRFSPLFIGIAVGVTVGMLPIYLPGIPFPLRLGLAGGPLIAAIVLSLIGSVGQFVWYIPYSANLALRELGIILFLACAGLGAGEAFFAAAMSLEGVRWMAAGFAITIVPLLTTGVFARMVWKQNYLTICGVTAGSMTDPPALAFANSLSDSPACSAAYAAVYPLTMILRIIAAQTLVLLFS